MPMQKALIETALSTGLAQKSDMRVDGPDTAEVMTNCTRTKIGAIRKRVGCKQLVNTLRAKGFSLTEYAAIRGVNYQNSPLLFDGYKFSSYSDVRLDWTLIDAAPEAIADRRIPVAAVVGIGGDVDFAPSSNYFVTAYPSLVNATTYSIQAVITDAASGIGVLTSTVISTATLGLAAVKVVVCGSTAIVAYADSPLGTLGLYLSKIDLNNLSAGWSAPAFFDTMAASTFNLFDMMPMVNDPTRFILGYFKGANVVAADVTVSTLVAAHTYTKAPLTAGALVSIAVQGQNTERCWVAYSVLAGGATHQFECWSFDDTAHTSTTAALLHADTSLVGWAQVGIARVSSTNAVIYWTEYQTRTSPPFLNSVQGQQVLSTGAAVTLVGARRVTYGVMLASKPAVVSTPEGVRCYALVNVNSSLQGTLALVCFDWFGQGASPITATPSNVPARLVVTVAPRLVKSLGVSAGDFGPGGTISVPKLVSISGGTGAQLASILYITQLYTSGGLIIQNNTGLFIQTFDFDSRTRYFGGTIAGDNHLGLSAGAPFMYDGQVPAEMGFLWYPEILVTLTAGGPSTGTFSIISCYEWTDSSGAIHRGATSPPITVSPVAQHIVVEVPTLGITWRTRPCPTFVGGNLLFQNVDQPVKIVIYATGNGGTTYYRQAVKDNDTNVPTVTFTDPGTGTTNVLLYTTGGVLDNYIPPSSKICCVHKNRWFLAGCDDPTAIWPSKALTVGEAPGFNEQMNIYATGAVTALASLDEKLIIFVKRGTSSYGIEYIVGEGPFDTGASNDFTNPPQPIPSSVGAIDQRSIAVSEMGVFFMSTMGAPNGGGGIYLLSRDLQVHYLSGAVEDIIALNPVCKGAVVHPTNGRVYFELAPQDSTGSSGTGVRVVYDTITQAWSQDSHYSFNAPLDFAAASCTWVAGGYGQAASGAFVNMPLVHWADYAGSVYRENSGVPAFRAYADVSSANVAQWVTATFQSAWFKPGLAGFARFWRAQLQSDSLDPANLSVSFTFDYAPSSVYAESMSFTDTQIAAFNRFPQVDVEHLVGNQKGKAIQVTLVDAPPSGSYSTGQGFQWATLSLEVGVEQSGRYVNLPPGQRG